MAGLMLGVIVNSVVYTFCLVVGFVLLCWYVALLDLFMLVILFAVGLLLVWLCCCLLLVSACAFAVSGVV